MSRDQSTDEDQRFRDRLRNDLAESVAEQGYIRTGLMLGNLAVIAVFLLGPEYLRMAACKVVGKQYRSPTQRMVEAVEERD